jgi:hypothetical protein
VDSEDIGKTGMCGRMHMELHLFQHFGGIN